MSSEIFLGFASPETVAKDGGIARGRGAGNTLCVFACRFEILIFPDLRWVMMSAQETWPIGVFTSIDAGLGVQLDVAHELGIPTIQLHAPHASTRTAEKRRPPGINTGEYSAVVGVAVTRVWIFSSRSSA